MVPISFPEPTAPVSSRAEVFLGYLDYFRSEIARRIETLAAEDLATSRLPSGWTPLELLKHLTHVELRWIEWGFEGRPVGDPWGDQEGDRWRVGPGEDREALLAALRRRAAHTRAVVETRDLGERGAPGPRWDGAPPATLERVLFHLVQEYARHAGHLDVVVELAGGPLGE